MGFDLVAKRRELGGEGYLHTNVLSMIFLRSAMLAAGVKEELIYKKFLANDGYVVTPLQARTIAEQLNAWLNGRKLQVDLAEENEKAKRVNDAVLGLFQTLNTGKQKSMAAHLRRAKSVPIPLSRKLRKVVREFARFCEQSDGFWIC
ncbi:MAG: hypothetical protein ABSH28_01210 [Acidobacteriota bacterium]